MSDKDVFSLSSVDPNSMNGYYTVELFDEEGNCISKQRKKNAVNPKFNGLFNASATNVPYGNRVHPRSAYQNRYNPCNDISLLNCPDLVDPRDYYNLLPSSRFVGWSSFFATYVGNDKYRGTPNAAESYVTTITDSTGELWGHKHMVFDFTTHAANGTFNTIMIGGNACPRRTGYVSNVPSDWNDLFGDNNSYQYSAYVHPVLFHPNFETAYGTKKATVSGRWAYNSAMDSNQYVQGATTETRGESAFVVGGQDMFPGDRFLVRVNHLNKYQITHKIQINGFPHDKATEWDPDDRFIGVTCGDTTYMWYNTDTRYGYKDKYKNTFFLFDSETGRYKGTKVPQKGTTCHSDVWYWTDSNVTSNGEYILIPTFHGIVQLNKELQVITEWKNTDLHVDWKSGGSINNTNHKVYPYYDGGSGKITKFLLAHNGEIYYESGGGNDHLTAGLIDLNTGSFTSQGLDLRNYMSSGKYTNKMMLTPADSGSGWSPWYAYIDETLGEIMSVGSSMEKWSVLPWFSLSKLDKEVVKTSATTMKITYDVYTPFLAPYDHSLCTLPPKE